MNLKILSQIPGITFGFGDKANPIPAFAIPWMNNKQ